MQNKQAYVEQMLSIMYRNGEQPPAEFLQDLDNLISNKVSIEELREKIIARYTTGGQ